MDTAVPDATLLIATGCVHCNAVLSALTDLLKRGRIGRLEIANIAVTANPDELADVRSVPWTRIGPFELTGAHTASELATWVERASRSEGLEPYLTELLQSGDLDRATGTCRRQRQLRRVLFRLVGDLDTPFAVRIGATAIIEELAAEGLLRDQTDLLMQLTESQHPQIRADAAHFLAISGAPAARERLRRMQEDADPQVREIVIDSLKEMG